jgi:hypothetical protein
MSEKMKDLLKTTEKRLTRQALIDQLPAKELAELKKKHHELRRRLLAYDAKILNWEYVSITLKQYESLLQYDPDCTILIKDLDLTIQYKML